LISKVGELWEEREAVGAEDESALHQYLFTASVAQLLNYEEDYLYFAGLFVGNSQNSNRWQDFKNNCTF